MNKWLEDFAYQTSLSVSVFFLAGIFTLLISWISISFIAVKAALTNPVNSLRYE
jgi:putative ABC transport system permease protein